MKSNNLKANSITSNIIIGSAGISMVIEVIRSLLVPIWKQDSIKYL